MSYETLLQRHSAKWNSYFDNGFIHVDSKENFQLAQAIYGSFYYLLTSLPNKQDPKNRFIGLSPGGLARGADNGDYSGHIFWDTETWMVCVPVNFSPQKLSITFLFLLFLRLISFTGTTFLKPNSFKAKKMEFCKQILVKWTE